MKGGPQELVRLNELAVDALLGTLADEDVAEYQALRARHPEFDDSELERAAAVMHLAGGVAAERLPETLRAKLAGDATYFFGAGRRDRRLPTPPHQRHASWKLYGGWMAAAACLIGTLIVWVARPSREVTVHAATGAPTASGGAPVAPGARAVSLTPTVSAALTETSDASAVAGTPVASPGSDPRKAPRDSVAAVIPAPEQGADPAADRARLLASGRIVLRRAWRAGNDPTGLLVSGDVVWDPATQTGYMRFVGLRRNEPNAEQYQLWIFDARRDERYPVDGGVFNVSGAASGDVIPIKAKLSVSVPLMFAVTIEHPGGVVVSDRARIAAVADTI
jgi:hypothetical protein